MVRNVAALWTLLLLLLYCHHHPVLAANNIGCLFSETLCEQDREWCFDDHAFGHCLSSYGHYDEDDLFRYDLGSEELRVLEQEMQRLFLLGYRWSHTYTQCILQTILTSIRRGQDVQGKEYDISECNGDLDQDLEGALRAIEGEELVDPRDLAIVRFTPSATDPHSDYADEVYFPPIKDPFATHPHDTPGEDGEERNEENGSEGGGGGEEGGKDGGVGGGGEEDNDLSPIPSLHHLPPPPPPHHPMQQDAPASEEHEDDRANNYISYYDDPGYQNDVYQSPYDFQHNPVFGKRSSYPSRPNNNAGPEMNYFPFIRKSAGALDDRSHENNAGGSMGRYRTQESVVFPNRFRQQQNDQDEGVFGESPTRPLYTEGGMTFMPQSQRERDAYGPDDDEVDDEGGMWSNNPTRLQTAGSSGIPGFGDQQLLAPEPADFRSSYEDQQGGSSDMGLGQGPEDLRGYGKQQSMPGYLRGFEDQQSLTGNLRGFGDQRLMPGELRNLPAVLRGYGEQRNMPGYLRNVPGGMRGMPNDRYAGYGQYMPRDLSNFEDQRDQYAYPGDMRSYRQPQEVPWTFPGYMAQRGPLNQGYGDTRPSLFDLRNYGQARSLPDDLRNYGAGGPMYTAPWSNPAPVLPRYRDLSRAAPLMMVAEEDIFPADADRFNGFQSMFGSQLNQLGPEYGQLLDYPDYGDYGDYQDYQDYDQDPRQLTQKFVKKDEETVGSDYGELRLPWNLPRTERLDVKKPGPFFRSQNSVAFRDLIPQYDPAFVRQHQGKNVNLMLARLQEHRYGPLLMPEEVMMGGGEEEGVVVEEGGGGGGEEGDNPLSLALASPLPDLLLADERYVVTDEDAPQTQADQGTKEEGETEDEAKVKEEKEEIKEEGSGEEKEASPSPSTATELDMVTIIVKDGLTPTNGNALASRVTEAAGLLPSHINNLSVDGNTLKFAVGENERGITAADVGRTAEDLGGDIKDDLDLDIVDVSPSDKLVMAHRIDSPPPQKVTAQPLRGGGVGRHVMAAAAVVCGVAAAVAVAAGVLFLLRRHAHSKAKLPLLASSHTQDSKDYEELCRARMSGKGGSGDGKGGDAPPSSGHAPSQRVSSLSKDSDNGNNSPSSRSSTSSWSEEPVASNMDISTGHMVLSYMEDHLKNKDRLEQEWIALCAYEAEPCATTLALKPENNQKNRYPDAVPYDHNRVLLNAHANISGSDYINASSITDHDPRNPAYIATQGPLETTAADFWQLVWEQGSVVIVMLTRLTENGHSFCYRYWPEEGSEIYHIYEVHLVSEHIWCDDYLVRSFYLKNVRTGETRTVTQFHFLSWHESGTPASTKALLEFRRKVNKSYRGRSCPIIVHCSDGIGRTGTYSLIDMVLNRMAKGAKEIDIAATLEHIRDQRPHMVRSKAQFEFVLMAVAEEVHAILKALPQ